MPAAARGRAAGKSAKTWRDAIERALSKPHEGSKTIKRLEAAAEALVAAGLAGDVSALKEIGDRIDGKAAQPIDVGGEGMGVLAQAIMEARDRASAR